MLLFDCSLRTFCIHPQTPPLHWPCSRQCTDSCHRKTQSPKTEATRPHSSKADVKLRKPLAPKPGPQQQAAVKPTSCSHGDYIPSRESPIQGFRVLGCGFRAVGHRGLKLKVVGCSLRARGFGICRVSDSCPKLRHIGGGGVLHAQVLHIYTYTWHT